MGGCRDVSCQLIGEKEDMELSDVIDVCFDRKGRHLCSTIASLGSDGARDVKVT